MQDTIKDSASLIQQPKDSSNISSLNLNKLPQPIDTISTLTGAARGPRGIYSTRGGV